MYSLFFHPIAHIPGPLLGKVAPVSIILDLWGNESDLMIADMGYASIIRHEIQL